MKIYIYLLLARELVKIPWKNTSIPREQAVKVIFNNKKFLKIILNSLFSIKLYVLLQFFLMLIL